MSAQDYNRSGEAYFEDGNIVIETQRVVFRVYRGIMSRNSSIFADMFSLPAAPQNADEMYDGCPLVHVSDKASDMEFFLRAIHDSDFYLPHTPVPCPTVLAILRLSTKYDVPHLRQRAIQQLRSRFPDTLEEFRTRNKAKLLLAPINVQAIYAAAQETGVRSIVPVLLYEHCLPGLESVLKASMEDDLRIVCIRALSDLMGRRLRVWGEFALVAPSVHCTHPAISCAARQAGTVLQSSDYCANRAHRVLDIPRDVPSLREGGMCRTCAQTWSDGYVNLRREAWDALPVIFGLSPWNELRTVE